jgi:hypothetical protein
MSGVDTSDPFVQMQYFVKHKNKLHGQVRERTIPTERPPLVGEFSANFCG